MPVRNQFIQNDIVCSTLEDCEIQAGLMGVRNLVEALFYTFAETTCVSGFTTGYPRYFITISDGSNEQTFGPIDATNTGGFGTLSVVAPSAFAGINFLVDWTDFNNPRVTAETLIPSNAFITARWEARDECGCSTVIERTVGISPDPVVGIIAPFNTTQKESQVNLILDTTVGDQACSAGGVTTYALVAASETGGIVINNDPGDGTFDVTLPAGPGTATFQREMFCDGTSQGTATVTIFLISADAIDDTDNVSIGASSSILLGANDTICSAGAVTTYALNTVDPAIQVDSFDGSTGLLEYTEIGGLAGDFNVTYDILCDGDVCDTATLIVTVASICGTTVFGTVTAERCYDQLSFSVVGSSAPAADVIVSETFIVTSPRNGALGEFAAGVNFSIADEGALTLQVTHRIQTQNGCDETTVIEVPIRGCLQWTRSSGGPFGNRLLYADDFINPAFLPAGGAASGGTGQAEPLPAGGVWQAAAGSREHLLGNWVVDGIDIINDPVERARIDACGFPLEGDNMFPDIGFSPGLNTGPLVAYGFEGVVLEQVGLWVNNLSPVEFGAWDNVVDNGGNAYEAGSPHLTTAACHDGLTPVAFDDNDITLGYWAGNIRAAGAGGTNGTVGADPGFGVFNAGGGAREVIYAFFPYYDEATNGGALPIAWTWEIEDPDGNIATFVNEPGSVEAPGFAGLLDGEWTIRLLAGATFSNGHVSVVDIEHVITVA